MQQQSPDDRPPVTRSVASWAAAVSFDELPAAAVEKSQQGILDTLGVALAGAHHDASRRVGQVVDDLGGRPQSTIIGTAQRTSMALAAFQNAYASHVLDFDDTHFDAIVHVNSPVTAAGLAVAEHVGSSGAELLAAHVAGLEVTSRMAIAAGAQRDHGWHLTGTTGAFGAAVTAARLLGLDAEETGNAIGIVSTLSSGLRGHRGTMTKALNPANAASNGIVAAFSARHGMTASQRILEEPKVGYFVTHGAPEAPDLADDLGVRFRMLDWDPKPYPCGVVIHPAIDAALALLDRGVTADQVESVELRVSPLALTITGNSSPTDGLQSKFSVFHATATALLAGSVLPQHFEDDWVTRSDVLDLRARISGTPVESTPRDEAEIVARLRDGTTVTATAKARGTRERRMTTAEVQTKFRLLTEPLLGTDGAGAVIEAVTRLPSSEHVGDVIDNCAGGQP